MQLLFDISFAQIVLCGPGADQSGDDASVLLENLENRLDPVDWELYGPLLHQRVQKQISSCSLLLAAIGALTKKISTGALAAPKLAAPIAEHTRIHVLFFCCVVAKHRGRLESDIVSTATRAPPDRTAGSPHGTLLVAPRSQALARRW